VGLWDAGFRDFVSENPTPDHRKKLERILQFLCLFFCNIPLPMDKPDGCYRRGQEEGKDRNESLDPNKAVGY
jgi:hypothetical protein